MIDVGVDGRQNGVKKGIPEVTLQERLARPHTTHTRVFSGYPASGLYLNPTWNVQSPQKGCGINARELAKEMAIVGFSQTIFSVISEQNNTEARHTYS